VSDACHFILSILNHCEFVVLLQAIDGDVDEDDGDGEAGRNLNNVPPSEGSAPSSGRPKASQARVQHLKSNRSTRGGIATTAGVMPVASPQGSALPHLQPFGSASAASGDGIGEVQRSKSDSATHEGVATAAGVMHVASAELQPSGGASAASSDGAGEVQLSKHTSAAHEGIVTAAGVMPVASPQGSALPHLQPFGSASAASGDGIGEVQRSKSDSATHEGVSTAAGAMPAAPAGVTPHPSAQAHLWPSQSPSAVSSDDTGEMRHSKSNSTMHEGEGNATADTGIPQGSLLDTAGDALSPQPQGELACTRSRHKRSAPSPPRVYPSKKRQRPDDYQHIPDEGSDDDDPTLPRCPYCDTVFRFTPSKHLLQMQAQLEKKTWADPLPNNPGHRSAKSFTTFVSFCARHQFEGEQMSEARQLNWPETVDFASLESRVSRLQPQLQQILANIAEYHETRQTPAFKEIVTNDFFEPTYASAGAGRRNAFHNFQGHGAG
jgi:hypothetical protein